MGEAVFATVAIIAAFQAAVFKHHEVFMIPTNDMAGDNKFYD